MITTPSTVTTETPTPRLTVVDPTVAEPATPNKVNPLAYSLLLNAILDWADRTGVHIDSIVTESTQCKK